MNNESLTELTAAYNNYFKEFYNLSEKEREKILFDRLEKQRKCKDEILKNLKKYKENPFLKDIIGKEFEK